MEIPGSFGDCIPYGDPAWYTRLNSPYFNDSHRCWRQKVREFVDNEIIKGMGNWEAGTEPPRDLMLKMGKAGFFACLNGPPFPSEYVDAGVCGPDGFDYFHEMILVDEIARCGNASVHAALTNGPAIALSAIMRFGTEAQKRRIAPDVLMGRKVRCSHMS